jgi:peroxiredoxin
LGAPPKLAWKYAEILHLPFPVLADPERQVYHLFGLQKAFIVLQRTASIIVDKDGVIRYMRTATNPMTWLEEHHELMSTVKELNQTFHLE